MKITVSYKNKLHWNYKHWIVMFLIGKPNQGNLKKWECFSNCMHCILGIIGRNSNSNSNFCKTKFILSSERGIFDKLSTIKYQ